MDFGLTPGLGLLPQSPWMGFPDFSEVRMSAQFRGRFEIKIDEKFRLILPVAYRDVLNSQRDMKLVITNSQFQNKRCLDVYPFSQWKKLEERIARLPQLKSEVQAFQRFYLSGGHVIEVDGQNRMLVPPTLRDYASLQSSLVLVGLGQKFEIWSSETWNGLFDSLAQSFTATLETISNLPEKKKG